MALGHGRALAPRDLPGRTRRPFARAARTASALPRRTIASYTVAAWTPRLSTPSSPTPRTLPRRVDRRARRPRPRRRALRRAARRRTRSSRCAMSDTDCEALRPYLFGRPIPRKAGDAPVTCLNLVDGEWRRPAELAPMKSLADRRITLMEIARSRRGRRRPLHRARARLLDVARVGERGARVPQARRQELLAPAPLLLRGVPRRAPPADAEDAPRSRQGLLRGQARGRSPRRERREGDARRDRPDDGPGPVVLEGLRICRPACARSSRR